VALLGYGLAGRLIHRPLVQSVDGLVVSHVVTSDNQRRAQACADVPLAQVLATADELWSRSREFDAVVVATGNAVHVEHAATALRLGRPVVVDKPVALTAQAAAGLVALAGQTGTALTVFHNRRWDSDTLTAARLMSSGRLGQVHRLESRFTRFRPLVADRWRERPGSGGILLDLGTHLVDQAVHLMGPVTSVHADVATRRQGALVDDDCMLELTHFGGARSTLWASAAAPWPGPRLVLQGSKAGWVKHDLDGQEQAQRDAVPTPPEPPGTLWDHDGPHPLPSLPGDWAAFYRLWRDALTVGAPLPVEARDAVEVLRVLEAARESCDGGEVVTLS